MSTTVSITAILVALVLSAWGCSDGGGDVATSTVEHARDPVRAASDAVGGPDGADVANEVDTTAIAETEVIAETIGDDGVSPDGDIADTADSGPDVPDLRHPHPELATLSAETLARIDAAMRAALDVPGLAGRAFGGLVLDVDTGQVVWQLDGDRPLIPASNTKTFTTAAALDLLGPDHRMLTRVLSSGSIGADGVLDGDLDLHGEHDFTWSRWFYADARHPADRLADALWQAGLRRVRGDLGVWGAYCYEGHHFATYAPASHRARAGEAFMAALAARGIGVDGAIVDHATMALPPNGRELARWESIPLWVGAWAILRKSHNEMADILARHLGYAVGGASDYAAAEEVIADWLAGAGVDTAGFTVSDGSGLSLANRVSARQLAEVYRAMSRRPAFEAWRSALSVGGAQGPASTDSSDSFAIVTDNVAPYNGTLAYRMTGADTAGRVFGKSGTNAGITTSGVLYHRWDGHRYAFAFLMNELPDGGDDYALARATQDALVAVIARDWSGGVARPAPPTLGCVRALGDGAGAVEVTVTGGGPFDASDARAGYALETSADGVVWRREDALFAKSSPLVLAPPAGVLFVRARAETAAGVSDASDVYAVRVRRGEQRVLLVDADDRWQRQPTNENPMGAAHAFLVAYAHAMPEPLGFDACPNEAIADDQVALAAYDAVVWSTGEEAASDESISAGEAARLADYLAIGGAVFASGAEIGWDLDVRGNGAATADDAAFYRDWLRSDYAGDDAGVYVLEGTAGSMFEDLHHERRIGFWTPGAIFVAYPDEMTPVGDASACMRYLGPGTVGCVISASDPAIVNLGIPFESIDAAPERALVMRRVMTALGLLL